jgi:4-hydroxythreonine-4-phosphate dehydrogenase
MIAAVTLGDVNGVGPEILLRAYTDKQIEIPFVVIGDRTPLELCAIRMGMNIALHAASTCSDLRKDAINILDQGLLSAENIKPAQLSAATGRAAQQYVEKATALCLGKEVDAVITLPINKEATRLTNERFMGHTELIAGICGTTDYTMMLASDRLIVTHVSTHVSQLTAIKNVQTERILNVIRLTQEATSKLRSRSRIAVAGLNPHAGEGGAFGTEDREQVAPAVELAYREGIDAVGPVAPDTVFYQAINGRFDAVVCMYHDQGHIPLKLLDFDGGVNVTLGLPIIRTSVDHGTAFDIAWQGKASTKSFAAACSMAQRLSKGL